MTNRITFSALGMLLAGLVLAAPASAQPWTPLTVADVDAKGICTALAASSPIKEYYDFTCRHTGDGKLGRGQFECKPKAELASFESMCSGEILACSVVPKAAGGKAPGGFTRMFDGMLLLHDKAVVARIIGVPDESQQIAGACMRKTSLRYGKVIEGLGVVGGPADAKAITRLFDTEAKRKELLSGAKQRLLAVRALWHMGAKEAAPTIATLLNIAHIKRYPGRAFREMALMAMAQWGSTDAEAVCAENLRDIKRDGDLSACMLYLARRGDDMAEKKNVAKKMVRQVERAREPGLHALGIMGTREAKAYLSGLRDKQGDGQAYIARDVALANAGDKRAWKAIKSTLGRSSRPNRSALTALGFLSANPKAAKKGAKLLAKFAKGWKKENEEMWALSMAVRAQLGDKSAIKAVASLVGSPDASVRRVVIKAIGGDFGNVWSGMAGFGLVADPSLIRPLIEAHENEDKKDLRASIGHAILSIRSATR